MKYFTVDSNLLMGFTALIHSIFSIQIIRKKITAIPAWVEICFYVNTVAVALTFSMVMVYLGPVFGYSSMFQHANLYFHLIIPVLSIIALCFFHTKQKLSFQKSFLALIPLLLYGIYYLGMIIRYGIDRPKSDWYWLAIGGEKLIPVITLVIFLCTWGLALILRFFVNSIYNAEKKSSKKFASSMIR